MLHFFLVAKSHQGICYELVEQENLMVIQDQVVNQNRCIVVAAIATTVIVTVIVQVLVNLPVKMSPQAGPQAGSRKHPNVHEGVYDTITIQCNVMSPYAYLEICVADDIEHGLLSGDDNAEVPKCCHPTFPPETPVVCYSVEISCDIDAENATTQQRHLGGRTW
jgi:hypothetical protein